MRIRAVFGALCVFLALVATLAATGGRAGPAMVMAEVVTAPPAPATRRVVEPARAAPVTEALATETIATGSGIGVARQCAASTILSRPIDPDGTRLFHVEHSAVAFDAMVARGCTRIRQGCNTCMVRYTGCSKVERAACKDGDCLARVCKRQTICTAKRCTVLGTKAPPCEARFAIHACEATAFDALDSRVLSRE